MRASVLSAPRTFSAARVPVPEPGEGEILIRVEGCGICASSLPLWQGRDWFSYPVEPGAPGHEVWGRTGDGRRVAALCLHGYAEWAVVSEQRLVELPPALEGLPFPGEAFACAVNVVRRAQVADSHAVAVVGMGFLGSAVAQLLGDVTEVRRDVEVRGAFDVVVEAAGTQGALDTGTRLVAEGGRLVVAGFHQDGPRVVDLQSWNWKGIDVVNAHERDEQVVLDGLREAVRLAVSGVLDVEALVTHRVPLDRIGTGFEFAATRPPGFLKAVVCP